MSCRLCGSDQVSALLEVGLMPVSNGYVLEGVKPPRQDMTLGHCGNCQLFQLVDPISAGTLRSEVPEWVRYGEPEDHLDDLCNQVCELVGSDDFRVAGTSYIDDSFLKRFAERGLNAGTSGAGGSDASGETTLEAVISVAEEGSAFLTHQGADLIIARHILDHVRDLKGFCQGIAKSLDVGGRVLFEVPSSREYFEECDHLMLWESHANYFAEESLKNALELNGFELELAQHLAPNSAKVLVVVGRKASDPIQAPSTSNPDVDGALVDAFVNGYSERKAALRERFLSLKSDGNTIAMLGAGHMGNLFLNLFDLGEFFSFVVDDDPKKSGFSLPGSGLPIKTNEAISDEGVDLLVMSVNRNIEARLADKIGGNHPDLKFGSIFADSEFTVC